MHYAVYQARGKGFTAILCYAHSIDALHSILSSHETQMRRTGNKIITDIPGEQYKPLQTGVQGGNSINESAVTKERLEGKVEKSLWLTILQENLAYLKKNWRLI